MATAEDGSPFVIDLAADRLLGHLSNDFSQLILDLAAENTAERTGRGVPVVTPCSIAIASKSLCDIIERGITTGTIPAKEREFLEKLHKFCALAQGECAEYAGRAKADKASESAR